jgi:hypothetical protein
LCPETRRVKSPGGAFQDARPSRNSSSDSISPGQFR